MKALQLILQDTPVSILRELRIPVLLLAVCLAACSDDDANTTEEPTTPDFYFGADLSFTNQIADHGGVYEDMGTAESAYKIFADHGTNLVRLRLWNNPAWTNDGYNDSGPLYNDLKDVEKSIQLAKEQKVSVLLDFHYSDTWADPGDQDVPAAWANITDAAVLKDSVYRYTLKVLMYLEGKDLLPEFVQIGNETNGGLLYTDALSGFPVASVAHMDVLGGVINSAIKAVREVSATSDIKPKIILHVADPKNVDYWFTKVTGEGGVSDFDIVGFSYYPLWHPTVTPDQISDKVSAFKEKFGKDVMILETAYPWTTQWADNYNNAMGSETPLTGYPYTQQGQYDYLVALTQEVKDGGGIGVVYWAPDWITSQMHDASATGSSWENAALFDYTGNVILGADYAKYTYK